MNDNHSRDGNGMGRTPAWEAEYAAYFAGRQRSFMRTAYAMLGDRMAAEDAVQSTFTSLYTHWPRIRPQQQHRAVPTPVPEREMLGLGLPVRELHLEYGALPVGRRHRHDQRAVAVERRTVDPEVPLVEQFPGQLRQPVEPGGPVRTA